MFSKGGVPVIVFGTRFYDVYSNRLKNRFKIRVWIDCHLCVCVYYYMIFDLLVKSRSLRMCEWQPSRRSWQKGWHVLLSSWPIRVPMHAGWKDTRSPVEHLKNNPSLSYYYCCEMTIVRGTLNALVSSSIRFTFIRNLTVEHCRQQRKKRPRWRGVHCIIFVIEYYYNVVYKCDVRN